MANRPGAGLKSGILSHNLSQVETNKTLILRRVMRLGGTHRMRRETAPGPVSKKRPLRDTDEDRCPMPYDISSSSARAILAVPRRQAEQDQASRRRDQSATWQEEMSISHLFPMATISPHLG